MPGAEPPLRILGDWGTSNLRLWLCAGETVIDRRDGPGLARLNRDKGDPAAVFAELVAPWVEAHGRLPSVLCGMVGANIGWHPAPYVDCPAGPAELARRLTHIDTPSGPVAIVPGLATISPLGGPDVMRGEETQIVGAGVLTKNTPPQTTPFVPSAVEGRVRGESRGARPSTSLGTNGGNVLGEPDTPRPQRFCLPGTHSKWAEVEGGIIRRFQTVMTGELFALLRQHSILLDQQATNPSEAGFDAGVARLRACGAAALPALLFETRSRRLCDGMTADDAAGFLSGLLIGAELAGIAGLSDDAAIGPVTLIGDPRLTECYARALTQFGGQGMTIDGDAAVRAGLLLIAARAGEDA